MKEYLQQIEANDYQIIPDSLYQDLLDEGWIENLETYCLHELSRDNFLYKRLKLLYEDKEGLINLNKTTIEKFNDFDIKLKSGQEYPYFILDFVDYKNGNVFIIRIKEYCK